MEHLEAHWQVVLLVLAVVAAFKRHLPQLKNYKTLLLALAASIGLSYDYQLPAWIEPLKDGLAVFCYAVGGHAYIVRLASKVGIKVPDEVRDALASMPTWSEEPPTKPDGTTVPPKKKEEKEEEDSDE
jgi:hypothetical protein